MRILVVEDEDKVSRFVVKGLTAERFAVTPSPVDPEPLRRSKLTRRLAKICE
jgi:DNA-binding response OmpR family regulator